MEALLAVILAVVQLIGACIADVAPHTPTRIRVPSQDIDLSVLPGTGRYPVCDAAEYLPDLSRPGKRGSFYVYAHARPGMFGPLLEASLVNDGESLVGDTVIVYTLDGMAHRYRIKRVKRHATDFDITTPKREQLVLQTSEGPRGTVPKLQVLALPTDTRPGVPEGTAPDPYRCDPS